MGVLSTVYEPVLIEEGGQVKEGFHIHVQDDEDFGGVYAFDFSWTKEAALESIFSGDARQVGEE